MSYGISVLDIGSMPGYTLVGQGANISDLHAIVDDMYLPSGTKLRFEGNIVSQSLPGGYISPAMLFNLAGVENVFRPFMPPSIILDDVRAEGTTLIVEMHATSPFLAPVLGFIAANWMSIVITSGVIAVGLFALIGSVRLGIALPSVVGHVVDTGGGIITKAIQDVTRSPAASIGTGIIILAVAAAFLVTGKSKKGAKP